MVQIISCRNQLKEEAMTDNHDKLHSQYDNFSLLNIKRREALVGIYRLHHPKTPTDYRSNVFTKLVKTPKTTSKSPLRWKWQSKARGSHPTLSPIETLPPEIIELILGHMDSFGDAMSLGSTSCLFARMIFPMHAHNSDVGDWANQPLTSHFCDPHKSHERSSAPTSFSGLPTAKTIRNAYSLPFPEWKLSIYDTSGREGDSRYLVCKYPWGYGTDIDAPSPPRRSHVPPLETSLYRLQVPDFQTSWGTDWLLRNQSRRLYVRLKLSQQWKKDPVPEVVVDGKVRAPLDMALILCIHSGIPGSHGPIGKWCNDGFDIVPNTRVELQQLERSEWEDMTDEILTTGPGLEGVPIPESFMRIWQKQTLFQKLKYTLF